MLRLQSMGAVIGLALGVSIFIFVDYGVGAMAHDGEQYANSVCPGFVILPNGHAVFSQEESSVGQPSSHRQGEGHGDTVMQAMPKGHDDKGHNHAEGHGDNAMNKHGQMAMEKSHRQMQGHDHKAQKGDQSDERSHLMGYQHGQAIVPKEKMLCVPVGNQTDTAWTTVGSSTALSVMVESMQGPLAHNSRSNEGLRLTILKAGSAEVIKSSQVRVLVRMPHHDHRMVGGHGIANDPDVSGMDAKLDTTGRYALPTLDFSMAGPWLVEVQVKNGTEMHKAYFAANVGEE